MRSVIVRIQDVHGAVSSHLKLKKEHLLSITWSASKTLIAQSSIYGIVFYNARKQQVIRFKIYVLTRSLKPSDIINVKLYLSTAYIHSRKTKLKIHLRTHWIIFFQKLSPTSRINMAYRSFFFARQRKDKIKFGVRVF